MMICFHYKVYPTSQKATACSRMLGMFTCSIVKAVFVILMSLLFLRLFIAWGLDDGSALTVSVLLGCAALYPCGLIKRLLQKQIDKIALKDFAGWDPEIYQALDAFLHADQ